MKWNMSCLGAMATLLTSIKSLRDCVSVSAVHLQLHPPLTLTGSRDTSLMLEYPNDVQAQAEDSYLFGNELLLRRFILKVRQPNCISSIWEWLILGADTIFRRQKVEVPDH